MREYLTVLLPLQRFYIPAVIILLMWAVWRIVWKRDLAVGLALYLALVIIVDSFLNTALYIPGLAQGSIRYSEICALLLIFSRPPAVPRHWSFALIVLLVGSYFGLLLLAVAGANPMIFGVFEFRREIVPQIVAFVIAMRGLQSWNDYRRFFVCMMMLSLIVAAFVFWDLFFDRWLIHSEMLFKPAYGMSRKHGRFGAFFLNPNYLGTFTLLVFPAAFVWILNEKRPVAKLLGGFGLLALAFCLVETQSRGPLLAFAVALPLLLFGPGGQISRTRRIALFVPVAAVFFILMPGFYEHATKRFETIQEEMGTDSRTRQSTWEYTQRIIDDNPILGIGYGERQFVKAMQAYGFEDQYGVPSLHHPHNAYLQMAVYAGYPAMIVFLLANGLLLMQGLRALLQRRTVDGVPVTLGPVIGIAAFLAALYAHNHMFVESVGAVYWVFFGLLLSQAAPAREVAIVRPVPSMLAEAARPVSRRPRPAPIPATADRF